jgi:hypothetical protein
MRCESLDRPIPEVGFTSTEKMGDIREIPLSNPLKSKSSDMKQKGKSTMHSGTSHYNNMITL